MKGIARNSTLELFGETVAARFPNLSTGRINFNRYTMGEKRGPPHEQYGGNRGGHQSFKKHKTNDFHDRNSSANTFGRQQYGPGANHTPLKPGSKPHQHHSSPQSKTNPLTHHFERLPEPEKCKSCKLAAAEIQAGMIATLDHFIREEAGEKGDQDIIHHARELQRLLSSRANNALPSKTKRDLDEKRPETEKHIIVPAYFDRKLALSKDLPPLPPIAEPHLQEAVFTHSSVYSTRKSHSHAIDAFNDQLNYERLEFVGDGFIELVATRLTYSRFPHFEPAQLAYLREQLVRNETLSKFSEKYGFADRLKHGAHVKDSKNWGKILADVFEAYVAAVVMSDPETGFDTVENWLTELWAQQLLDYKEKPIENPRARDELNKLVMAKGIKLDFREERNMTMVNGLQRYFIGVYLTGWGFEDEWLGSGEGQNKSEACIFAAMDAVSRQNQGGPIDVANKRKLEIYPPKSKEENEAKKEVQSGTSKVKSGSGNQKEKSDSEKDLEAADGEKKDKKKKHEKNASDDDAETERKKKKKNHKKEKKPSSSDNEESH